jgi:hypothetical protein
MTFTSGSTYKYLTRCIHQATGTKLIQWLKQKSPAVSSEALQYVVPEAESIRSNNLLFYSG